MIYRIFFEKKKKKKKPKTKKKKEKKKETIIDVCYIKARTTKRGRAAIRLTTLPQSIHVFVNN